MRILSLEIANLRCYGRKRFEFRPGFNLLVGENGQGKTTVIRSLLTALGAEKNLRPVDRFADDDVRFEEEGFDIDVEYHDGGQPYHSRAHRKWRGKTTLSGRLPKAPILWFGANESTAATFQGKSQKQYGPSDSRQRSFDELRLREEFIFGEEYPDFPEEQGRSSFGRSAAVRRFVGRVLSSFSDKFSRFGWSFVPYNCVVRLPTTEPINPDRAAKFRRDAQAEIMRLLDRDNFERRLRRWPSRRSIAFNSKGEAADERMYVRPIPELNTILERVSQRHGLDRVVRESIVEIKLAPRIVVIGREGPLPLSQLSDGEKRIFSMLVDIARQLSLGPDGWREIEHASAIVLIDEIDCHLHPRWQRMIVPALEDLFPACQFIATTHSPFIAQAVRAEQLQSLGPRDPLPDFTDRGLEEVTFKVMRIENHEVSPRYLELLDVAKEFYAMAYKLKEGTDAERRALRERMRKLSGRYVRNPAFQAFLEMKTEGLLGADTQT